MRIERVDDPGAEWDEFVAATPGATLAHAAAWPRVFRDAYGLESLCLAARDAGGRLAGVLPMVRFHSISGARELVSMPFHDTGGVLASDAGAEAALLDAARSLANEAGIAAIELRQAAPLRTAPAAPVADRVDLVLPLPGDAETLWKGLPAKVRNQTRKAEREGLSLAPALPASELVQSFYAPFAVNMRDLGSPVHGIGFFRAITSHFGPRARVVVVRDGARPVGGLVAIHYAGVVTVPWASTLRNERSRCPNNLQYWEALRFAVAVGAHGFDFGRSAPGSGTHRFKKGWGAEERPLYWLRLDSGSGSVGAGNSVRSRLLERLSAAWRLLPVAVTVRLGPRIRRRLSQ
ncbi:hypothetical protein MYXO_02476 [Myxococcaceae bacterium]|jgi:FemAB-related protein (PEP-CTERM system-associated)|nr:hypothetical protein MYXO_02476 [Myxococcaceae bacterium]